MKQFLALLGGIIVIVGLVVLGYVFMFTDGIVTSKYNNSVGIKVENSKRNMYEHSATYVEGKAQELSKAREELSRTKDIASRKAIVDMLRSDCANLDINDLNDGSLRDFLNQIRNGQLDTVQTNSQQTTDQENNGTVK